MTKTHALSAGITDVNKMENSIDLCYKSTGPIISISLAFIREKNLVCT